MFLKQVEARMNKISTDRPDTFIEAVQLLFAFHCCLHLSGEQTSIGRLDQLLEPFLGETTTEQAQEIIDCLFVKLCEHVHLNTRLLNSLLEWGMNAVPYSSTGMFPNGDTINQWVQQVRKAFNVHVVSPPSWLSWLGCCAGGRGFKPPRPDQHSGF